MFVNSVPDIDTAIMGFLDLNTISVVMMTCKYALGFVAGKEDLSRYVKEHVRFKSWLKKNETEYKVADGSYIYSTRLGGRRILISSWDALAVKICPRALKPHMPKKTVDGDTLYLSAYETLWSVNKNSVNKYRGISLVKGGIPVELEVTQHCDFGTSTTYKYTASVHKPDVIPPMYKVTRDTPGASKSWILVSDESASKQEKCYYCMINQGIVLTPLEPLVVFFLASNFDPIFQWLS